MKVYYLFILVIIFILLIGPVSAGSTYGSIDVYYNDKLLPGKEIAKPFLKVGEPFKIKCHFTVYQKCYVSVKLSELEKNTFIIIDGPIVNMDKYIGKVIEENSTEIFEWTLKPTKKWAGGSIPLDFIYQIDELGSGGKTLVNGGFTVAYCTISNEYYEGEDSTPKDQSTKEIESPSETKPPSTSTAAPAFTIVGAVLVLALISFLSRR